VSLEWHPLFFGSAIDRVQIRVDVIDDDRSLDECVGGNNIDRLLATFWRKARKCEPSYLERRRGILPTAVPDHPRPPVGQVGFSNFRVELLNRLAIKDGLFVDNNRQWGDGHEFFRASMWMDVNMRTLIRPIVGASGA